MLSKNDENPVVSDGTTVLCVPFRRALAPLLVTHASVVAVGFGALLPLNLISSREGSGIAAGVTESFSRIAGWLAPMIFAGLLMKC